MNIRIHHLASALLAALSILTFTSCEPDDDRDIAATLNGTWHGYISTDYYWDNYHETGWETEFRFASDDGGEGISRSGTGIEVDYNPNSWRNYHTYEFTWAVLDGDIVLKFHNGDMLVLRNYRLSDDWLSGELRTDDGVFVADLDLERTSYWPWSDTRAAKNEKAGQKRIFQNTEKK